MAKQVEIVATVLHERHRFENDNGDVAIFDAAAGDSGRVSLKGGVDESGPGLCRCYRFYGVWRPYTNKRTGVREQQFCYTSFVPSASPAGREAIVAYLSGAPGVGRVTAGRFYEAFGESAVREIRENPKSIAKFPRMTEQKADVIVGWLERNAETEQMAIDVAGLFQGRGFPASVVQKAIKTWGNRTAEVVRRNPYVLMRFRGVGFRRADSLYTYLGLDPSRLKRQALCAWNAVSESTSGDTWVYDNVAIQAMGNEIDGADAEPKRALRLAVRAGLLKRQFTDREGQPDSMGDVSFLALSAAAEAESSVASNSIELLSNGDAWPLDDCRKASRHQVGALSWATSAGLGVLCGSPGTGKTYVVAQIVRDLLQRFGAGSVSIAAPTGKAAVRCSEAMADEGVPIQATTIHSLLGVASSGGGNWQFQHNELNPLEAKFFIVDEASMVDVSLMSSFMRALPAFARLLLVGDTNQLLPVGHGAPLRDMIAAGVPTGELREIRRNSGAIVEACAAIRDGEAFSFGGNLSQQEGGRAIDVVRSLAADHNVDVTRDVQVVCAVNDKSEKSRRELNRQLQGELNGSNESNRRLWVGDKVICLKNGSYRSADDVSVEHRVANGEIGFVVEVKAKAMRVRLDAPRRTIWAPNGDDSPWDLAYAISVHKAQGSEFPCVVVVIDESPAAGRVCDRAWIYTAISRAKQHCVLWGPSRPIATWVRRNRLHFRKTFLRERVAPQVADAIDRSLLLAKEEAQHGQEESSLKERQARGERQRQEVEA